jgi:integrase
MRSGELQAMEWEDIDGKNGLIRVSKSYNRKIEALKCPKNGQWRNVDINPQLWDIIKCLRVERGHERFILPEFAEWKYGYAGKGLRKFLQQIGIQKDVTFHTLRACFATQLLSTGVEAMKVMRMGGWNDLKTFQIYLRMSGVDVKGIAGSLDVIPSRDMTNNVIPLFS